MASYTCSKHWCCLEDMSTICCLFMYDYVMWTVGKQAPVTCCCITVPITSEWLQHMSIASNKKYSSPEIWLWEMWLHIMICYSDDYMNNQWTTSPLKKGRPGCYVKSPTVQGATVSQGMTFSLAIYITHTLTTSDAKNVKIFKCTIRLCGQRFCVLLANQNATQFHINIIMVMKSTCSSARTWSHIPLSFCGSLQSSW